ncbi:MAG: sigma-70 family RNA polymerase sigma factor [Steroidobacteraceae bacterium]|nr:sigma-70 family RNA polymerase sigma factor [Steroidobacteraceae bacterium]MDW8260491.1 sigma-70 family RNA polymerase sigma factor [Gammaproteobacteria bacterium]
MMLLLLRHTRDPQLAQDILQEAIVTTLAKFVAGNVTLTPVIAGFVFRTAMNHLRNHWRRERVRASESIQMHFAGEIASPEDVSQREADARAVRRVLRGLGLPRDREVLVRFYLHEQSKAEICDALGINEPEINRVLARARERLRRQLECSGLRRADLLVLLTTTLLLY